MRKIITLASLLFFITANAQIISTQFGQIQGHQNGNVYEFLGIPFAKPPVDSLRWKAPQSPDAWGGTFNASAFAPACPQKYASALTSLNGGSTDTIIGNEDCLYLNVWTPQLSATANLPVLVFIHGGGNQQGSANEVNAGTSMYHGKNIAARGNAVVVTIQYRLGPLGFLVHPGLAAESSTGKSGNYAVLDQILALQWVKNNITRFGGDTTKTMVFGESAGGVNTGNLLTSPLASGLFTRAGIQSAGPTMAAYSAAENSGVSYINAYTASGTDAQKIAYMRSLPADSLVKDETQPMAGGIAGSDWAPVMDGVVFTDYPFNLFRTGNFNHVPLLIGSNADETQMTSPQTVTPAMVNQLVASYFPTSQAEVLAMYPPGTTNAQARTAYIGITTDAQFTAITRRTAQCVSANQTEPVWRYFFTYTYPASQLASLNLGSYHGMELLYVFNNWENINGHQLLFKPQDDSLQQVMLNYWVNFARTGNPNGTQAILADWPQYDGTQDCYMEIKAAPDGSQCGIRTAKNNMWDLVMHFTPCAIVDTTTHSSGIVDTTDNTFLKVYPNPAQNNLTVELSSQNFDVVIFDIAGRRVFVREKIAYNTQIDCSKFANGTYTLRCGNISKRIIIMQ